jgi:hypothetical protein
MHVASKRVFQRKLLYPFKPWIATNPPEFTIDNETVRLQYVFSFLELHTRFVNVKYWEFGG